VIDAVLGEQFRESLAVVLFDGIAKGPQQFLGIHDASP
jgi:hypothetical protein